MTAPRLRRAALALLAGGALAAGCGGDGGDGTTTDRPAATAPRGPAAAIRAVDRRRLDARLEEWTLRTPALARPTRVRVLVPAGYRDEPRRRYPVLYLLHGAAADHRAWTRFGDAEAITARAPLIVVMPDGGADGWYTDWYAGDRAVRPRWETYHVGQLVPWIDATYRTIAGRRGRAIAGLSMGGFGALSYAARHPRTFAAAASYSGALEIGSRDAWGPWSANGARWREHLPLSIARRLRSLALLELRTGDGRPGRSTPGARAAAARRARSSASCTRATCGSTSACARSGSATRGTTTVPAPTAGRTGGATCAGRSRASCARSRARDGLIRARRGYPSRAGERTPEVSPMAKDHGSSVKDDKTYEEVRKSGASKEKAARIANAKAGGGSPSKKGGKASKYEDQTKEQLQKKAADVGIEGRSKMSKGDLVRALRNH